MIVESDTLERLSAQKLSQPAGSGDEPRPTPAERHDGHTRQPASDDFWVEWQQAGPRQ